MARCNEELKREGKREGVSYPRTCALCRLGPCKRNNVTDQKSDPLKQIAGLIGKLSWRQMREFAATMRHSLAINDELDVDGVAGAILTGCEKILNDSPEPKL